MVVSLAATAALAVPMLAEHSPAGHISGLNTLPMALYGWRTAHLLFEKPATTINS